jgi:hypothetical protein
LVPAENLAGLLPAPHFPFLPVVQASLPVAQAFLQVAQASRSAAQAYLLVAQASRPVAQASLLVAQASLRAAQASLRAAQASLRAAQASLPAAQVSLVTRGPHQRLLAPLLSGVLALGEAVYLLEVLHRQEIPQNLPYHLSYTML